MDSTLPTWMEFNEEYSRLETFAVEPAAISSNGIGQLSPIVIISMTHVDKIIGPLTRHYFLSPRDAYALEAELNRVRFLMFGGQLR